MPRSNRSCPVHAHSDLADARAAVADVLRQLGGVPRTLLFFCAHTYDLEAVAAALGELPCVVVGCTSAGQIGASGFEGGITAVGLFGVGTSVTAFPIAPLSQERALAVAEAVNAHRLRSRARHAFGLVLFDGLARAEERVTAALYHGLADVALIGGSAGDGLEFKKTSVYVDGAFRSDCAVLALFETDASFLTFKLQHFEPRDEIVVVTASDPETRRVYELNGEPAALAYAELVGTTVERLDSKVFSHNPLVLVLGNEVHVRSIARVEDDLSLTLFCAIEDGVVLHIGRPVDPLETIRRAFDELATSGLEPELVIGCDCVLRRLEFESLDLMGAVGRIYAERGVFGFSTYGEQFNAVHMNQTFTGVALGS